MKILVIASRYNNFTKELNENLSSDEKIENISVFVPYNPLFTLLSVIPMLNKHFDRASKKKIFNLSNLPNNIKIYPIKCFFYNPYILRNLSVKYISKKIYALIIKNEIVFDIIHAHFTWPSGLISLNIKQKILSPILLTLHENREWFLNIITKKSKFYFRVWKRVDVITRVNKKDADLLKTFFENVEYVKNGVDFTKIHSIDRYKARDLLGIEKNKVVIFNFSNLIKRKGHIYLIKAIEKISEEYNNIECYIGGTGPKFKMLEKYIKKHKLENIIKLVGFIPNDKLSLYLSASDLFVFPSLSESFGIVQVEALASGLPVVSFPNGSSDEILISEEYGYICNEISLNSLIENIRNALNKDWNKDIILSYGRQYDWKEVVKEYIKIYEQYTKK
ncbi:MAG: glycosyltransferase [Promethearchaeota archaeon]